MTNSLLTRRDVTLVATTGLLASCTNSEPPGDDDSQPSEGGGASDGGQEDGPGGGEGTGQEGPDDDMVDDVIEEEPFDGMTVTRVTDGAINSWDLTMLRGGTPLLRYRMQGRWDGQASQLDGYQRMEEARALEGASTLGGEVIIPRSNWEFAFQIVVDGDAQFVPYHGTATAVAKDLPTVRLDGDPLDPESLTIGEPVSAESFSLAQTIVARHPARGEEDLVEVTTTTTWTSDGRGRIDGTWRALQNVEIGNAYGPMLPFSRDVFDRVITDTGGDVGVEDDDTSETVSIANTTTARIASSEFGWSAAISWDDPEETLRTVEHGGGTDVFLQLRDDGIGKIYPQVWDVGDRVEAGATWEFGAEWAVTAP